ncbi:hypothetical protein [Nodosilinea sp. P-1105]|uniref:hypothetical protein n=1 Tax=Nodosilinea sp. P-1105 TaxID=2546229 RepID=UPI00146C5B84|nr:hypothetical protein [Nodosilinea sp. P-1105]NMF85548.1 hypothetical protein [Nodosilinea sp. P-1105]
MKIHVEKYILNFFRKFGYDIVKYSQYSGLAENHIQTLYQLRSSILVGRYINAFLIDINQCVSHNGFSFSDKGWHPFVSTLLEYKNDISFGYENSILKKYYAKFQPDFAMEPCITTDQISTDYLTFPSYTYFFPWEAGNSIQKADNIRKSQEAENLNAGYGSMKISEGFSHHGPVSARKGEIEYKRLIDVYSSIQKKGYVRDSGLNGDIAGTLLYRDGKYRFLVEMGFHRISSLRVLGYQKIPVRLMTPIVVEKRHVNCWPQIKSGIWNIENACIYFDSLFDFDSAKWAAEHRLSNF